MRTPVLLISLPALLTLACTSTPPGDDEVGVTTAVDETAESTSETSESGTTGNVDTETTAITSVEGVDGFDMPAVEACDVWTQDCPVGQKCVPYANDGGNVWNDYKCVDIMGEQAPGEPCVYGGIDEATDDCDATSICFDTELVEGELIGTCHAQCTGSPAEPMCEPGSFCSLTGEGALVICIPLCDPLLQDCEEGDGCYWAGSAFQCVFTAEGGIPTGGECGYINDCEPGNLCADAGALPACAGAACCTSYCDASLGDVGCAGQPETVCALFFEPGDAPVGYENVGVCVVP